MTRPQPHHMPPAPHPVACLPPCCVLPPPPLHATAASITCRHHPTTPTHIPLTHLTTHPPTLSIHSPAEFPSRPLTCHPHSLLTTCSHANDPTDVPTQTHENAPPTHDPHRPPMHRAPAPNAQTVPPHSSPSRSSALASMHPAAPMVSLPSGTHSCSASRMTPASR